MAATYFDYTDFDESLVRPLYGYINWLEYGNVPVWVIPPVVEKRTLRRLLKDTEKEPAPAGGGGLPEGINAVPIEAPVRNDRSTLEFEVEPELYFELMRGAADAFSDSVVRLSLAIEDSRRNQFQRGRQETVPEKIVTRLESVTETSCWEQKTQRQTFKQWVLTYNLGTTRTGLPPVEGVTIEAAFV